MRALQHRDFGGWIEAGIGMAIGFALLHLFGGLFVLLAAWVWYATATFRPLWRRALRLFSVVLVVSAMLIGIAILAE